MTTCPVPESLIWTTSSFSDGGANCVMVGRGATDFVGVGDSKTADMPAIMFPITAWSQFLNTIKTDPLNAEPIDDEPIAWPQEKSALYELDLTGVTWQSAPGSSPTDRVEIALLGDGAVALRHPKSTTPLRYTRGEWRAFTRGVMANEFDVPAPA
ncbi:DUF397 domain-containing protein [Sphaerisporangium sp. NPDC049003]|uniref:DUF397 domain-containing protein n=1 Tax=Sphaerisporangium sp. NPDC049003 TaxID=3364517 RepID=UPI003716AE10